MASSDSTSSLWPLPGASTSSERRLEEGTFSYDGLLKECQRRIEEHKQKLVEANARVDECVSMAADFLTMESGPREKSELELRLEKALNAALKIENKKHASLSKELQNTLSAEAMGHWATLVIANLHDIPAKWSKFPPTGAEEGFMVEDWDNGVEVTLNFDPSKYDSARAEADAKFTKARKLRRGSKVVTPLLEQSERYQEKLNDLLLSLELAGGEDAELLRVRKDASKLFKNLGFAPSEPLWFEGAPEEDEKKKGEMHEVAVDTSADFLEELLLDGGDTRSEIDRLMEGFRLSNPDAMEEADAPVDGYVLASRPSALNAHLLASCDSVLIFWMCTLSIDVTRCAAWLIR